jgi:hypothetical protein
MSNRKGNSHWGKPQPAVTESIPPTSFEEIVAKLGLRPAQYVGSQALKEWVRKNMDRKYVPLDRRMALTITRLRFLAI